MGYSWKVFFRQGLSRFPENHTKLIFSVLLTYGESIYGFQRVLSKIQKTGAA